MAKQKNIGRKRYHVKAKRMVREIDPSTIILFKFRGIISIDSLGKSKLAFAHVGLRPSDYIETYV